MEDLLAKYGWPERSEEEKIEINQVEKLIDFILPKDYENFLKRFLGGEKFVGEEFIQLWDLESLIELNNKYKILSLLEKTIGIGSNGSGELICIKYHGKMDYEYLLIPAIDPSLENHYSLAESFTDLLKKLDKGMQFLE